MLSSNTRELSRGRGFEHGTTQAARSHWLGDLTKLSPAPPGGSPGPGDVGIAGALFDFTVREIFARRGGNPLRPGNLAALNTTRGVGSNPAYLAGKLRGLTHPSGASFLRA